MEVFPGGKVDGIANACQRSIAENKLGSAGTPAGKHTVIMRQMLAAAVGTNCEDSNRHRCTPPPEPWRSSGCRQVNGTPSRIHRIYIALGTIPADALGTAITPAVIEQRFAVGDRVAQTIFDLFDFGPSVFVKHTQGWVACVLAVVARRIRPRKGVTVVGRQTSSR